MTEETRQEKEGFAARWSRLKRQQATSPEEPTLPAGSGGSPPAGTSRESGELPPVETLPDPDSLEPTADFSVFMRENVPEMLRRKALRRLWRSNPIIGTVDMLDDYCEDFTDAATVVPALRTVYKLGKGMLDPAAEEAGGGAGETVAAAATGSGQEAGQQAGGEPPAGGSQTRETGEEPENAPPEDAGRRLASDADRS